MNKGLNKLLLTVLLTLLSLFFMINTSPAKGLKADEADLIDVNAAFKANIVRAKFTYINRRKGARVNWDKGSVDCDCRVYGIDRDGNGGAPTLLAAHRQFLKKHNQKIYIDIPEGQSGNYARGVIQCEMAVGWESYRIEDEFNF